ncbi:hypothetical protein K435DRAFT_209485 [Dendrothele bispora CBS 962.96]|uniref:Uncharacterized protein n=1 Tax=Dendrothele bispora (strain CBS 962.96) TaxID=1314807 RepID=A0A4S8KK75_DENBC|nr:hypothetical protein K435DRAFT_209485 [Dendrothele bispora CBS 962.96]
MSTMSLSTPNLPIRSFDGRVGAVIGDSRVFVTTPNMDMIYAPTLLCQTRMRRCRNFAKDDPCFYPQPYFHEIGHLAVIPCTNLNDDEPLRVMWYIPKESDWEEVAGSSIKGVGFLKAGLFDRLRTLSTRLFNLVDKMPEEQQRDVYIRRERDQLRKLLERLEGVSSSGEDTFLLLSCAQRLFLELFARRQWLLVYLPQAEEVNSNNEVNRRIMGAFTDNLDTADRLFRMGIPVWLVRSTAHLDLTRIDKHVVPLDETFDHRLPLRDPDLELDVSHRVPEHELIYTGLPGSYKRYLKMAQYVYNLYSYTSLLGSFGAKDGMTPTRAPAASASSSQISSPSNSSQPSGSVVSGFAAVLEAVDVTSQAQVIVPEAKKQSKKPCKCTDYLFMNWYID